MPIRFGTARDPERHWRWLLLAAAAHDVLAKLMYAHRGSVGAGPADQIELGAQLMYYGGTVVEVALGIGVLARWYVASGRDLGRQQRRSIVIPENARLGSR